jgi:hypothetical protein
VNDRRRVSAPLWLSILVELVLRMVSIATALFLVRFYHGPAPWWVMVLAMGLFFISGGVQDAPLLQRSMRIKRACHQ